MRTNNRMRSDCVTWLHQSPGEGGRSRGNFRGRGRNGGRGNWNRNLNEITDFEVNHLTDEFGVFDITEEAGPGGETSGTIQHITVLDTSELT